MDIEQFRGEFKELYEAAKFIHDSPPSKSRCHAGHTLLHDTTVAAICLHIAPDESFGIKAACAAFVHSFDHCMKKEDVLTTMTLVLKLGLKDKGFRNAEVEGIIQAAYRHKELNQDDQPLTQQILMDADRLANLSVATIVNLARTAPGERPSFETEHLNNPNPKTTYREPQSVFDEIRTHYAYLPMFRLPKAKEMAATYMQELQSFEVAVRRQHEELGLVGFKI